MSKKKDAQKKFRRFFDPKELCYLDNLLFFKHKMSTLKKHNYTAYVFYKGYNTYKDICCNWNKSTSFKNDLKYLYYIESSYFDRLEEYCKLLPNDFFVSRKFCLQLCSRHPITIKCIPKEYVTVDFIEEILQIWIRKGEWTFITFNFFPKDLVTSELICRTISKCGSLESIDDLVSPDLIDAKIFKTFCDKVNIKGEERYLSDGTILEYLRDEKYFDNKTLLKITDGQDEIDIRALPKYAFEMEDVCLNIVNNIKIAQNIICDVNNVKIRNLMFKFESVVLAILDKFAQKAHLSDNLFTENVKENFPPRGFFQAPTKFLTKEFCNKMVELYPPNLIHVEKKYFTFKMLNGFIKEYTKEDREEAQSFLNNIDDFSLEEIYTKIRDISSSAIYRNNKRQKTE